MYTTLLFLHSLFRWLVVICLLLAIIRSFRGYVQHRSFSNSDNALRHWTATVAHLQLTIGMVLYFQSPVVSSFWKSKGNAPAVFEMSFFSLVHALLMLSAIVVLTIGSAKAKRKKDSREKFRIMFLWFLIAFLIILAAIPWPFSPLANRPLFRPL